MIGSTVRVPGNGRSREHGLASRSSFDPRLGQGAFRVLVTDIYNRRCAITQERTLPALEAAHIRPYGDGGEHEARNGLLLRRDIHSLFDAGYVTVTPDLRFEVSRRIKEEFDNGKHYYELHGRPIFAPSDVCDALIPRPCAGTMNMLSRVTAMAMASMRLRHPDARGGFRACANAWVKSTTHLTATELKPGFVFQRRAHPAHQSAARYFQAATNAIPAVDQDRFPEAGWQGLV